MAACITRKRIAFRQFKAWYWQCFDTNVQARGKTIEHTRHHFCFDSLCTVILSRPVSHLLNPQMCTLQTLLSADLIRNDLKHAFAPVKLPDGHRAAILDDRRRCGG